MLPFRKRNQDRDFPGGAVVKNPPSNAGDTVQSLVWEDPTCRGATKPMSHSYLARVPPLPKPPASRAHAPQQEKPPQ